jgi:hypothetical protein
MHVARLSSQRILGGGTISKNRRRGIVMAPDSGLVRESAAVCEHDQSGGLSQPRVIRYGTCIVC